MTRRSTRAGLAVLLLTLMLPLAACPGKGYDNKDGEKRGPTAPS